MASGKRYLANADLEDPFLAKFLKSRQSIVLITSDWTAEFATMQLG